MKTYLQILLLSITPVLALTQNNVFVSTDKAKYFPSDTITVTFTYWNNTDTTTLLTFSSACQYNFCVDSSWCWGDHTGCATVLTSVSIPPYSSHSWIHDIYAVDFALGIHTLTGWIGEMDSTIKNYGTGSTTFTVRVNEVTVSTDKSHYDYGDTVIINITYWNNTDTTTILKFPSACQFNYCVDSWCRDGTCAAVLTDATIPPHSTTTWSDQIMANFNYGTHTLVGWIGGMEWQRRNYGTGTTTFTVDSNQVTVSTDKSHYLQNETINILLTYWNHSNSPIQLNFPSTCQFNFYVDSSCWACSDLCMMILTSVTIPAHSSGTWNASINANLPTGIHTIVGWIGGIDSNGVYGIGQTTFTVDSLYTITCNMADGWNMISVPILLTNFNRDSVFPGNASYAFSFNRGYKTTDTLQYGTGYWIKYNEERLITLKGHALLIDTIDVEPGWNMIGSLTVPILKSSLKSIPPGIISPISTDIHFYGGSGPGYLADSLIRPGIGYWIKVNGAGKIILDGR